jgi:hypothetical protein
MQCPDRKVDIKDNHLGIKLIPMISTWDQVDPIFPVRWSKYCIEETVTKKNTHIGLYKFFEKLLNCC